MDLQNIEWTTQLRFIVALALGFLVGLERESIKSDQKLVFGGVRTNPIISMFGFGCAWLYQIGATFILPAGLLAISSLAVVAYIAKIKTEKFGSTSELSALLTFITGASALLVDIWVAMAMGIVNTILLSEKAMLESYVDRLSKVEFLAVIKFLLVTLIILPVLPNQNYTSFNINPTKVWHIVIIVSSLGFVGYLLEKKFGDNVGLWLSGFLGGIVSSTAVTIAVGRIAQKTPSKSSGALQASILASSVMYIRVLALIWFINDSFVSNLWFKLTALAVIGFILSFIKFKKNSGQKYYDTPELQNPFEIKPAIVFALLFVGLSIATNLIKKSFGDSGLLWLSAIVGVSDIDPFILSLVQNSDGGVSIFTSAIILAMMSNTIAKAFYFNYYSSTNRKESITKYLIFAASHIPFIVL